MHQPNISAMRMRMRFDSLMLSQAARVFFIDDARITMRGEWNFVQHFSVRLAFAALAYLIAFQPLFIPTFLTDDYSVASTLCCSMCCYFSFCCCTFAIPVMGRSRRWKKRSPIRWPGPSWRADVNNHHGRSLDVSFFFFFLSNRKLVGTNVSPHFLFLSHPHGHPRTSAFFSPADFSILFDWPFLFSRLQPSEPTSLFPTKLNPRSPPVLDGRSMDEQADIQQRLMAVMEISHASLTAPAKNHRRIWRAPFILYSSITIPSTVTLQSPYIKFIMIHTASYCGWMDG